MSFRKYKHLPLPHHSTKIAGYQPKRKCSNGSPLKTKTVMNRKFVKTRKDKQTTLQVEEIAPKTGNKLYQYGTCYWNNFSCLEKKTPFSTKIQHTLEHHPRQSPRSPIMKGIPENRLLVKVARGVFQRCGETTLDI